MEILITKEFEQKKTGNLIKSKITTVPNFKEKKNLKFTLKIFNFQGESTREISEGKTLLGKYRKKWKLKQCTTQRILAFNERYEIYRCRINKKTVSDLQH